jgi:hypothetical protein
LENQDEKSFPGKALKRQLTIKIKDPIKNTSKVTNPPLNPESCYWKM